MPKLRMNRLLNPRSAAPIFGRLGADYFEIDHVQDGVAHCDGEPAGSLRQRRLGPGVTRVTLELKGSRSRTIDDLMPLPEGEAVSPELDRVGDIRKYHRSRGAQRNTALALGFCSSKEETLCFESFALGADEEIYGLGERHLSLRLRGSRERLWIGDPYVQTTASPVYLSVPLVVSTAGWGIAVLHGGGVIFEIGNPTSDALTVAIEGGGIDYLVFESDSPAGVLRSAVEAFGLPNAPPDWSLGVWISRLAYFSRAEVEHMAESLEADGFPMDVMNLDPFWHEAKLVDPAGTDRTTFVWNEPDFGPSEEFFREMERRRLRVSLWESPYLFTENPIYDEARARDLLLKDERGEVVSMDDLEWTGGIVDFTKPEAAEWWKERHIPLLEAGASAIKADFGESVPEDALFSDGRTGAEAHNLYPLLYHRAVAEVCRKVRGEDFVIWARSGFLGSWKHDVVWVGDSVSTWEGMVSALRSVLSLSMSGFPFVSVDIGGFILWDELVGPPAADLFVRWSQWGLLVSHSRFHGVGGREPILIEEPERSIVREMCRLRMRWLPYFKHLCEMSANFGDPVVRPLVYTWPDDPSARADELSYTLGPSILVAPVLDPTGRRTHYLPPGAWVDHFTGERHEGGRWISGTWPLDRFPLYLLEGVEIPDAGPAPRAEDALR